MKTSIIKNAVQVTTMSVLTLGAFVPFAGAEAIGAGHGAPDNVYMGGYLLGGTVGSQCRPLSFLLHNQGKRDVKVSVDVDLVTSARQLVRGETFNVTVPPGVNSKFWTTSVCDGTTLSSGSYGYIVRIYNGGGHNLLRFYGILAPFTI
jgi:hypothetical protein